VIPGFVLAGGASRRMGRDKALVLLDGVPLAARVAAVLAAGGCEPVSLVGRQPELGGLGWPVVVEAEEDRHPLWGVAAALEASPAPWILICPCDLIHLLPAHVAALLAVGGSCVGWSQGRCHPLLAVVPTAFAAHARTLAAEGAGVHALTGALPPVLLPPKALFDANREEDLSDEAG